MNLHYPDRVDAARQMTADIPSGKQDSDITVAIGRPENDGIGTGCHSSIDDRSDRLLIGLGRNRSNFDESPILRQSVQNFDLVVGVKARRQRPSRNVGAQPASNNMPIKRYFIAEPRILAKPGPRENKT